MPKFKAPEHTSSISAPTREISVDKDGIIQLPDDAPDVELDYLRRAGCVLVAEDAPESGGKSKSKN